MENNKLTQELLKSLKRIADALENSNKLKEDAQKRTVKFEKIQEKKAALELKELQEKRKVTQVTEFFATKIEEDSKPKDVE